MFDHKTLTKAVQALQGKVRWHKLLSLGIFLGCFLVLPFSYWRFATSFPTFIVIGLLYLLMFTQAFLVWRQVRRDWTLRPGAWLRIFSVAFFPPSSIRVLDWLSHLKIPGTHPLTLLQKEEEPACFHREAAKLWRETRWPLGDFPYRPWDGLEVQALAAYFKKTGIKTESLEEPPSLAASTSYCPRCLTVYAESAQTCSDCNGINLMKSTASR